MRWPWRRGEAATAPEERASATDAVIRAILTAAKGTAGDPGATAAAEIASGAIGRALAGARLTDAPEALEAALTPSTLALVGRALVRRGEAVLAPVGDVLLPAHSWTVEGGPSPGTWTYDLSLSGPSTSVEVTMRGPELLHFTWATEPGRPWAGVGPLAGASLTAEVLAESEGHLRDESKAPRGTVFPQTEDNETALRNLTDKLKGLAGGIALVQSTRSQASTMGAAPLKDWEPQRYGFNAPATLEAARTRAGRDVLAACGVPVEMVEVADGTGQREAYRRFLHTTLEPIGRRIASEIRAKHDAPGFALDFRPLFASDLAGRARAFQSLVQGGMDVTEALALTGLLADAA